MEGYELEVLNGIDFAAANIEMIVLAIQGLSIMGQHMPARIVTSVGILYKRRIWPRGPRQKEGALVNRKRNM